jgi:cation transport regulator ChaB
MEDDDNINNIKTKLNNIKNKLSNKLSEAISVEPRLKEAEKAYDVATEEEKEEKEGKYLQVLQEYDNVYNEFNILQEIHKDLIIELKEYISGNHIYKDEEDSINEYLANMEIAEAAEAAAKAKAEAEAAAKAGQGGGKRKSKGKSKKVSKKPVVSQKKQSIYKEIFGKKMKIYKMPDSRKEYVKYKGELHHIADYKDLMKQKANAKPKAKTKPKK